MDVHLSFKSVLCVWVVFLFCVTGCNCEDTGDIGTQRELIASPPTLSFDGKQGETVVKEVQITAKLGAIQIDGISIVTGASHYALDPSSLPELPASLDEGQSITLKVRYKATQGAAPGGKLRLESDATIPTDGTLDVFLLARSNQQQLVFRPNPVDFGSLERGASKVIEVEGKNEGRADLVIQKVAKKEGTSAQFGFPDGLPKARTLKPGESFRFKVKYEADTNPIDKGALLFTCEGGCAPDDPDPARRKNPYELKLQGTVGTATIEVTPLTLDFGFVASGSEKTMRFRIRNGGKATLRISKIALKRLSSGAFQVPSLLDVEISPGETKEAAVRYRPTVGSEHKGTVEIASNDPSKPLVSVNLIGKVTAPNIEVTPKLLSFGKAPVFKRLELTIANTGNQPLEVDPLQMLTGTSKEFRFEKAPTKFTVNPNAAVKVAIVYRPVDNGEDKGKVLILSNDPDEPKVEVELVGLGLAPKICDLVAKPAQIQFGLSLLGKSTVRELELANEGAVACQLVHLSIATVKGGFPPYIGPDVFLLPSPPAGCQSGNCSPPVVIPPGNSIKVKVSFFPQMEKPVLPGQSPAFEGSITVDAGAAGETATRRTVLLNGIPTRPCITVVPDQIDFGRVTTNCGSKNEKVVVFNSCTVGMEIKKIGFAGGQSNGFRIVSAPKTPFTLAPQKDMSITLQYRSTAPPRKQSAALHIEHAFAAISPLVVGLVAEGTTSAEQTDTFKQPNGALADVLFVIDNSGSMGDEQYDLSRNIKSFVQWATSLKADFHFGVTSTEINPNGTYKPGELRGGSNRIFTQNTPNLVTAFQNAAKVGTGGFGAERGLDAAHQALSPTMLQGPNKGFLRKDASLSIIAVSDEPDQSNQAVQFYINFFKGLKGGPRTDRFRFHSVIGYDPKSRSNSCGQSGGPGSTGRSHSAGRYLAVTQASGGIVASICNTSWVSVFKKIGLLIFSQRKDFYLSRPADPKTIVVKVDGTISPQGANTWSYDASSNAIQFSTPPAGGAIIVVTYKAICFP